MLSLNLSESTCGGKCICKILNFCVRSCPSGTTVLVQGCLTCTDTLENPTSLIRIYPGHPLRNESSHKMNFVITNPIVRNLPKIKIQVNTAPTIRAGLRCRVIDENLYVLQGGTCVERRNKRNHKAIDYF